MMIFFKLLLISLTLTSAIAGRKAINSTSLSYSKSNSLTTIFELPSSGNTADIASNTTNINPLSNRTSNSISRGNISFTEHSASGYTHSVFVFSSHPSLFTPTGAISFPTLFSSMATETGSNTQALTVPKSRGYSSSSQLGLLVASSSSAVLVVTETGSAGIFPAWFPIITTITSPPPTYTSSLVSNALWHSDTTTKLGATIFPVFYSCGVFCGGDEHGLIIKGLGGDPTDPLRTGCGQGVIGLLFKSVFSCGTEFNFPPLFPFTIGVDGTPEIVRDQEDPKSTNLPSTASARSTASMTSASIPSTESSSSSISSRCRTGTAFPCTTAYICSTGATVSCSATLTCPAMATSCSLTSSSSSATPSRSPSKYLIDTIDSISQNQTRDLASFLMSKLGPGNVTQIPVNETKSIFVAFMNSSIASDLKEQPLVSSIDPDHNVKLLDDTVSSTKVKARHMRTNSTSNARLTKRERLIWQEWAPLELTFISQPRGRDLSHLYNYVFDEAGGQDVSIYIFDSGADVSNPDFISTPDYTRRGSIKWLPEDTPPSKKTDEDGHGTCIASKAVGNQFGVAKSADLVLVKPYYEDDLETMMESDLLLSFSMINEHVKDRKLQGKAVINISLGVGNPSVSLISAWKGMIKALLENDVVVVVSSGNDRDISDTINAYPALFKQELPNLIVVGSVDTDGSRSEFSQGGKDDLIDVSAPGSNIECASNVDDGNGDGRRVSGTSAAAPTVAGLVAYFLSINSELQETGMVAQNVLEYIKGLAWPRNGGPIAIWNNISFVPQTCNMGIKRARRNKRGTSDDTACFTDLFDSSSTYVWSLTASEPILGTEPLTTSVLAATSTLPLTLTSSISSMRVQTEITASTSATASASASTQPYSTTSEPAHTFLCDNTSLEDEDGICTCSGALTGTSATTLIPPGGLGNFCPTYLPSTRPVGSISAGSSITTVTTAATAATIPEATCMAVANIANTVIKIWTNYITDSGNALRAKEIEGCPGVAGWTVFNEQKSFAATSGTAWVSSQSFQFTLQITHPQELACVQRAIMAAGGPTDAPQCSFAPAISPP